MAIGHRIVWVSLFLNVTLASALLKFAYPQTLQAIADFLFGAITADPNLRVWYFYGLLYGVSFFLGLLSTHSIGRSAVQELAENG